MPSCFHINDQLGFVPPTPPPYLVALRVSLNELRTRGWVIGEVTWGGGYSCIESLHIHSQHNHKPIIYKYNLHSIELTTI